MIPFNQSVRILTRNSPSDPELNASLSGSLNPVRGNLFSSIIHIIFLHILIVDGVMDRDAYPGDKFPAA